MKEINDLFVRRIKLKDIENKNGYPFDIPMIKNFSCLEFNKPVTFIVGENGSGKSTLIEALAINLGLNPEGGSQNFIFNTFDTHSELSSHMIVEKGIRRPSTKYFLRAESFYNVATETEKNLAALYGGMNGVSLHKCSHGEFFLHLIENRFYNNGLYILDEPEAALSPTSQMKFLVLLDDLVKNGCQLVICTHSPIILSYPNAEIYQEKDGKLELNNYKDTDIYNLYRSFLFDTDRIVQMLLNTDE